MVVTLNDTSPALLHHDGCGAARQLVGGNEVDRDDILHDVVAGFPEFWRRCSAVEIGTDVGQGKAGIVDEDVHAAGALRSADDRIAVCGSPQIGIEANNAPWQRVGRLQFVEIRADVRRADDRGAQARQSDGHAAP